MPQRKGQFTAHLGLSIVGIVYTERANNNRVLLYFSSNKTKLIATCQKAINLSVS